MSTQPHFTTTEVSEDTPFLSLTQADLDRGLSSDQIDWLHSHLNVKALIQVVQAAAKSPTVGDLGASSDKAGGE